MYSSVSGIDNNNHYYEDEQDLDVEARFLQVGGSRNRETTIRRSLRMSTFMGRDEIEDFLQDQHQEESEDCQTPVRDTDEVYVVQRRSTEENNRSVLGIRQVIENVSNLQESMRSENTILVDESCQSEV